MASKWRDNVADLGWTGGPFGKIARVVGGPNVGWALTDLRSGGLAWWFQNPVPGQYADPVQGIFWFGANLTLPFPYGVPVEIDA